MFKKLLLIALAVMMASILLVGCGGSESTSKSGFGGDILRDKEATKKAVAAMKEKGGTPLMLFQSVNFNSDFISFNRQDPKKPENVDSFMWHQQNGWQGPKPVKLRGDGKMEDNIYNADEVNWEAIPDFVAAVEKKAKESGMEKIKLDGIMVYLNVSQGKLSFSATVKGERNDASASGDIKTGEITYFKIR
ncbi:hypothetical protein LJC10_03370 [Selenomonadales bacterium OttesenSCG-928-I06]|nr:hypothetical protein [Selenomonadales bacterium OttesenSCG-928-I06]